MPAIRYEELPSHRSCLFGMLRIRSTYVEGIGWGTMKFAVLDFETTGSQPIDEIIQVGLVVIEDHKITDRYSSFVKPGVRIPEFITGLTGITDEMVSSAPSVDDVISDMQPLLADAVLVAHHAAFDLGFLQRALDHSGYSPFTGRVLDTLDFLRILYPSMPSLQLSMATQWLSIPHERPHQADSDAEATALLWLSVLERLDRLDLLTVQRLAYLFETESSDFNWFIQTVRETKERETTVDPDAGRYYRQISLNIEDWGDEKPVRENGTDPGDSFEEFYNRLKEELRLRYASYEDRESQEIMVREVSESLEKERHLMIEAGTGTGKSLGYLVPSLYYAIKEDKKVIVSTHTIQLQEQLRQRDVPLLHDLVSVPFKVSVLKGRNHYLCLRKFEQKINLKDFDNGREDRITAAQMVVWLSETQRGDDEELFFGFKGGEFWQTVASDADSCLNRSCPWFRKCFYHRAKNEANLSDVVITNHSLLFTDMKAENRLLPGYKHLVVDEAHHFEETASKHLGIELAYFSFVHGLTWLFKDSKTGLLPLIQLRLEQALSEDDGAKTGDWIKAIDALYPELILVKEHWDELSGLLFDYLAARSDPGPMEGGQLVLRMKEDALPPDWERLMLIEENIYVGLGNILRQLDKMASDLKDRQEEWNLQSQLTDLNGAIKDLQRYRDELRFFMKRTDPDYVYWLEASPQYKAKSLQLVCLPTDVSKMMQQFFFDVKESIILTSATLSVDKTFDYTCRQLGLNASDDSGKLKTVLLPSPFRYREQALVCVPRDFPGIKGASGEVIFIENLVHSLKDVAIATKGRMLVLFTSYRMLKSVHQTLKDLLSPHGIQVLGQGLDSGNRSKLTRLFQESEASVLLGTSSFWEGVDIPGQALSCLAIVRLPFQPPNHPLVEAKCENIKKNQQNPFMKYSVPQAVIRFKQGFGRLIRTGTDKGIVILYDTRVIDTQYGKHFLYSLPGPKIEHMATASLVPRIMEWMEGEEA